MKLTKLSYVKTASAEANVWTPQEDFVLSMLVGTATFKQIGLRLGRSAAAVQRRASRQGYLSRDEALREAAIKRAEAAARADELLASDVAEAFVVDCAEPPVLPHVAGKTYHREYKRAQRSRQKESE